MTMPRKRSNTNLLRVIPTDSRTKAEMFQAWRPTWKLANPVINWATYWNNQLKSCVDFYEEYGWKLLCIAKDKKIPVKGVRWAERDLTYENALTLIRKGMNLAANLKKSRLIVADLDDRNIPAELEPYFHRTISVISPHGYHIYFRYDIDVDEETLDALCQVFGKEELFRGGRNRPQFVLVPLSCVEGKHYEFINKSPLMDFSELLDELERLKLIKEVDDYGRD
jgi:hypothetical protein